MKVSFPFERQETQIFGEVSRPIAEVSFWSKTLKTWVPVKMIVDTGADYTLLPRWLARKLGISIKHNCKKFKTYGIGGSRQVYLIKGGWKVKVGTWTGSIILGFIGSRNIPPLMGRLRLIEELKMTMEDFTSTFEG